MDLTPLFLNVLGGIPLLVSYYSMVRNVPPNKMWGHMPKSLRRVDYLTIPFAFAAGIYMIYYSITKIPKQLRVVHHTYDPYGRYILYTAWTLLLIGANMWPLSLLHRLGPVWVIGGLVLTAIGACLLADCVLNGQLGEPMTEEFVVAIVSVSILLFQTGIMDLGVWSFFYLGYQ